MLTLATVLFTGCSSNPEKTEPEGYFATRINEGGEKLFQFTLDIEASNGDKQGARSGGRPGNVGGYAAGSSSRGVTGGVTAGTKSGKGRRGGSRNSSNYFAEMNSRLENRLEQELKTTGYCREGFQEIERMTGPSAFFIKGKCDESATEQDRQQFPEGAG